MMRYQGKKKLYEFLVSHGYIVSKMKDCKYQFYHGSEWIKDYDSNIELYSPSTNVVFVTVTEIDEEDRIHEIERCRYDCGELVYKTVRGKIAFVLR